MPAQHSMPSAPEKQCKKCKKWFPPTPDFFYFQQGRPGTNCITCHKAINAQWRAEHPDAYQAGVRQWREKHRPRIVTIPIMPDLPSLEGCEIRHIVEWPGYAITNTGDIWSCRPQGATARHYGDTFLPTWHKLKLLHLPGGYPRFRFSVQGKRHDGQVHRLVLETFVGPCPDGMQGCHQDGDSSNNHLSNLRWDTPKGNAEDRGVHGHNLPGELNPKAKLKEADIPNIFERYNNGAEVADLCLEFGVDRTSIHNVLNKKTWKHASRHLHVVVRPQRGSLHHNTALDELDILAIRRLYDRGHSENAIAPLFGVNRATIGYIIRNKTWQHVDYLALKEKITQKQPLLL